MNSFFLLQKFKTQNVHKLFVNRKYNKLDHILCNKEERVMCIESRRSFQCNLFSLELFPFLFFFHATYGAMHIKLFQNYSYHFILQFVLTIQNETSFGVQLLSWCGKGMHKEDWCHFSKRKTSQIKYLQLFYEPSLVLVYCGKSKFLNVSTTEL